MHRNVINAEESAACDGQDDESKAHDKNEARGINFWSPHTPKQLSTISYMAGYIAGFWKSTKGSQNIQIERELFA